MDSALLSPLCGRMKIMMNRFEFEFKKFLKVYDEQV